jgi:hypothetical protein
VDSGYLLGGACLFASTQLRAYDHFTNCVIQGEGATMLSQPNPLRVDM